MVRNLKKRRRKGLVQFSLGFVMFVLILLNLSMNMNRYLKISFILVSFGLLFFGLINSFYKKRKEILLFMITFFLCFVIFEIVLRINYCTATKEIKEGIIHYTFPKNAKVCGRIKEGLTFKRISNNEGFLDNDFSKDDNFIVYFLGDSFAQCLEVNYEFCGHKILEEKLEAEYGKKIKVYNFGMGGYGTLDEHAILKTYKEKYPPDAVILMFLPYNDLTDNDDYLNFNYENVKESKFINQFWPKSLNFLKSKLTNIIKKITGDEENKELVKKYQVYAEEYTENWNEKWEIEFIALDSINNITKELEIPFIIVVANTPEQVYETYWNTVVKNSPSLHEKRFNLEKPNKLIKEFAEEKNIYFVDLLPYFKNSSNSLHYPLNGHWTEEGHGLASEIIYEYIIEEKILENIN